MLNELKIDELLDKVDSRYGLVVASAKRARQINEYTATLGLNESLGIPGPQVHTRSQHPLSISIEELRSGRLEVGFKELYAEANPGETAMGETATSDGLLDDALEAGEAPDADLDTATEDTDLSGEGEGAA